MSLTRALILALTPSPNPNPNPNPNQVTAGGIFFREFDHAPVHAVVVYALSTVLVMGGLAGLSLQQERERISAETVTLGDDGDDDDDGLPPRDPPRLRQKRPSYSDPYAIILSTAVDENSPQGTRARAAGGAGLLHRILGRGSGMWWNRRAGAMV